MASEPPASETFEKRREQMFPRLEPDEVQRLGRFGESASYQDGEALFTAGEASRGMFVVLSGKVRVTSTDEHGEEHVVVDQGPGNFLAEVGQLSGRPALVTGRAVGPVTALVIPPERVRALLIAEAELGERIMRSFILRRMSLMETGGGGPAVVGHAGDVDVVRLTGFLTRNSHPFHHLDPDEDEAAEELIARFQVGKDDLPIVLCPSGVLLKNPGETQLAQCLGLVTPIDPERVYDVAVVGAGPAGLATAVYAASEGLSVLVIDERAHGGQAGASARIENYFGFPTGISGQALVSRAYTQALKFGAEMAIPAEVEALEDEPQGCPGRFRLTLADGQVAHCQSTVIASGVRYRRPDIPGLSDYVGASAHFWASPIEAKLCSGQEVALIGGGNSAGQACVFLAGKVKKVWLLVRSASLEESMSQYLIERIKGLENVEVLVRTEATRLEGRDGQLDALHWRNRDTGEETRRELRHLFLFVGAEPNTDWLARCKVKLDNRGFVLTGPAVDDTTLALETSVNGVFAIGDVRSGSTKRVASAVGEGAQVVATIHRFLADPDITPEVR